MRGAPRGQWRERAMRIFFQSNTELALQDWWKLIRWSHSIQFHFTSSSEQPQNKLGVCVRREDSVFMILFSSSHLQVFNSWISQRIKAAEKFGDCGIISSFLNMFFLLMQHIVPRISSMYCLLSPYASNSISSKRYFLFWYYLLNQNKRAEYLCYSWNHCSSFCFWLPWVRQNHF